MKITMSEQVLRGNFAGNTDEENQKYAENYVVAVKQRLAEYCTANYPDAEVEIDLYIDRASGCARGFEVEVITDDGGLDTEIAREIESRFEFITDEIERSGEIYED